MRARRPSKAAPAPRILAGLVWVAAMAWLPAQACAQAVSISATVDKTTVDLGTQLTLTITVEGDLEHVNLKELEFPEALPVVAQSRASNVSIGPGQVKRSISLIFILAPREAGTFQLGPFQATHQNRDVSTQPIEITVKKPVVPPTSPATQRYVL